MIQPGRYTGYLKSAVMVESPAKGTPGLEIEWEIDADEGRVTRSTYFWLSEAARPYSFDKLQKLGFNGDFQSPQFPDELTTEGCTLVCQHENDDKGELREKWDAWPRSMKQAEDTAAKDMTRLWRSEVGKPKPAAPGKPVGAPPPQPAKPAPPPPKKFEVVDTADFIGKVTDYDTAWEQYVAVCEASGSEPDSDLFQRLAGEHDTSTADGCKQLFTAACIPF